jgi:hypothetical protein
MKTASRDPRLFLLAAVLTGAFGLASCGGAEAEADPEAQARETPLLRSAKGSKKTTTTDKRLTTALPTDPVLLDSGVQSSTPTSTSTDPAIVEPGTSG